mgnify:CR=1 FL=1
MPFRFKNLKIYQGAKILHKIIVRLTRDFPQRFYYLLDQTRRASLSVVLNIAEGSGKNSDKDFNRYIGNSLGSLNELVACLEVALEEKIITKKEFEFVLEKCESLSNQLGAFSKRLKGQ